MNILESVPRPVLYAGGAVVILFFVLRGKDTRKGGNSGYLDATVASMSLAASSNIEALAITSQRDVALAGEYTARYQIAQQMTLDRESMGLDLLRSQSAGRRSITMQAVEQATIRRAQEYDFELTKRAQDYKNVEATRQFELATKRDKREYKLQNKFGPIMFQLELAQLAADKEFMLLQAGIQNRRVDISESQALLGNGGIPGALGSVVNSGLDIYGATRSKPPADNTGKALTGAATGAAVGGAVCAATGWFTFGGSCIPAVAAGAAGGGGGGLS